jgi:hypothetical protein
MSAEAVTRTMWPFARHRQGWSEISNDYPEVLRFSENFQFPGQGQ